MTTLEPIVHEYDVTTPAEQAFDVFVGRTREWWRGIFCAKDDTHLGAVIEPRVGGRVYHAFSDQPDDVWGEVTAIDPPRLLVHSFWLAHDATHPSQITVRFEPSDAGTHVRFEHGGWHNGNASYRSKYQEWPAILDRYAALAST